MKSVVALLFLNIAATLGKTPWDFTVSNNNFAASVYKVHSVNVKDNFLISPFSAEAVLALAEFGAKGETAEEIRKSLFLPEDRNDVESTLKQYLSTLGQSQSYSLHTANKIYVKDDYPINEEFKNITEQVFDSELESVDFSTKEDAAAKINKWVEKKTESKIRNLINPEVLNNKTKALLLNTLLFKGNWSNPFQKFLTYYDHFYVDHENVAKVEMMHDFEAMYNYCESEELDAKFLEIPFKGDNVSMTIVLPNNKDGLHLLEQQIERVLSTNNFTKEIVNVALPRFKIKNRVDLKEILKTLGVNKAFIDGEADFSGVAGKPGELHISEVMQKSFISVDEDGVEAASATFIIKIFNRNGLEAINFTVNHPFIFYIKIEELIIFIGRVSTP